MRLIQHVSSFTSLPLSSPTCPFMSPPCALCILAAPTHAQLCSSIYNTHLHTLCILSSSYSISSLHTRFHTLYSCFTTLNHIIAHAFSYNPYPVIYNTQLHILCNLSSCSGPVCPPSSPRTVHTIQISLSYFCGHRCLNIPCYNPLLHHTYHPPTTYTPSSSNYPFQISNFNGDCLL